MLSQRVQPVAGSRAVGADKQRCWTLSAPANLSKASFFPHCTNQGALGHDDVQEVVGGTNSRVASDFSALRGHECLGGTESPGVFQGEKSCT